ncbi:MAG: hypothetical protein LBG27_04040 [Spirochaetaceae bacterium]|nr:hypothetical protein [Spirochaetaceae bacterium]
MYSNELKAVSAALDALAKALRGKPFEPEVTVEGGKDYGGAREVCAKIIVAAQAAGELAVRVAALEA